MWRKVFACLKLSFKTVVPFAYFNIANWGTSFNWFVYLIPLNPFLPVKSSKDIRPLLTVVGKPERRQDSDGLVDESRDLRVSVEIFVEDEQGRFDRGKARWGQVKVVQRHYDTWRKKLNSPQNFQII